VLFGTLWRLGGKYPDLDGIANPEERESWANLLRYVQVLRDCERFHCLPSQLDGEDYHLLQILRSIDSAEARYRAEESKAKSQRAQRGRGRR